MRERLDAFLTAVFPKRCFLCGEVLLPRQRLCAACVDKAPYILPPVCERCGRGVDACTCKGHHRHFDRCVSAFYHRDSAYAGLQRLKTYDDTVVTEGFATEMAEVVRREYGGIAFDYVTSVPMHKKDYRDRGFDQAAGLAKEVARLLGVTYHPLLKKIIRTEPQKEMTAVRRRGNLLGVFDAVDPVVGQRILLVDDVITTGSTLDECAKVLKIYGAEEVYGVTAVAAVLQKEKP